MQLSLIHHLKYTGTIVLAWLLLGCNTTVKSDLVQKLENTFYNANFISIPNKEFNVRDYGAIGDGKTLATEAIQKTINAAHKNGGTVIFPKGIYLSGALFVKSNVKLYLEEGVVVKAIQNNKHYPECKTRIAGIEMMWPAGLINIYDAKNVQISGKGIIDGNGKYWWDKFWGDPKFTGGMWVEYKNKNIRWAVDYDCKRVRPVVVYKSENVSLKEFTVQRAGFWTVSLTYSNNVHVDNIVIRNNIDGHGPSSDGINTDSSTNVLVENCDIDCNDDNLGIKSGKDADGLRVNKPAKNIVYRNCITRSGHGLITLGSETSGGMENIEVYGLEAIGTNIGIRFKSAKVRGGTMHNISFHNIKMTAVTNPFHFELNWYPEYSYPKIPKEIPADEIPDRWKTITQRVVPAERGIPKFHHISFRDIEVKKAKEAFYVNAYAEKPMHHLYWKNITIDALESGRIHHARNWQMENVKITTEQGLAIQKINCKNIENPIIYKSKKTTESEVTSHENIDTQIEKIFTTNDAITIVPIDLEHDKIIRSRDTIKSNKIIPVYLKNLNQSQLNFYEPLGDGFYYSPVKISTKNKARIIEVTGQKKHLYKFYIQTQHAPLKIENVDHWEYNASTQEITIHKTGSKFKINIENE